MRDLRRLEIEAVGSSASKSIDREDRRKNDDADLGRSSNLLRKGGWVDDSRMRRDNTSHPTKHCG